MHEKRAVLSLLWSRDRHFAHVLSCFHFHAGEPWIESVDRTHKAFTAFKPLASEAADDDPFESGWDLSPALGHVLANGLFFCRPSLFWCLLWSGLSSSVKPRVMTSQSSVISPKTHLETAQNSAKHYKKQVMRAVFALPLPRGGPAWSDWWECRWQYPRGSGSTLQTPSNLSEIGLQRFN